MGNYGGSAVSWLFTRPTTAVVPIASPDPEIPTENVENIKRIDQTYQWILVHAPGVHPDNALSYAHLLYDAKLGNMDRIGRKLAKEPQLLESLGFEEDDAEEIFDSLRLAGLLGGDNATLISDVSSTHYTTHHNSNTHQMALLKQQAKKLGPEHAITLSTVANIASLLKQQGDGEEAKVMYERALRGREKTLGLTHKDTLQTVLDMALLLRGQGNLSESETYLERAYMGRLEIFGKDHPDTLITVSELASLYHQQGKLNDARAMFERALQGEK